MLSSLLAYKCSQYAVTTFFCISVVSVIFSSFSFLILFGWVLSLFFLVSLTRGLSICSSFQNISSWFYWSFLLKNILYLFPIWSLLFPSFCLLWVLLVLLFLILVGGLIPSFILLWSERMLEIISSILKLLRLVFWPSMWSIPDNVSSAIGMKGYSSLFFSLIRYQLSPTDLLCNSELLLPW